MKKTSLIFLTLVASCSITFCAAQDESLINQYPSDYLIENERIKATNGDTVRRDTVRRDTNIIAQPVQITYNYYYRSRFFNSWYRFWLPRRYYATINRPGFVPRRLRGYDGINSVKRGGFGGTGGPAVHHSRLPGGRGAHSSGHTGRNGRSSSGHSAVS